MLNSLRSILPLAAFVVGWCAAITASAQTTNQAAQITALKAQINDVKDQVTKIINQPVTAYARQPGMNVGTWPYWFHPGANEPDYDHVDIRTSQELPYAQFEYVTSDLNPGVVFPGKDLEFNPNTKLFYVNRSLPKKRLTEAEMLEINRLYRLIGDYNHQLAHLFGADSISETTVETNEEEVPANMAGEIVARYPLLKSTTARATLIVVLVLGIFYLFRRRKAGN